MAGIFVSYRRDDSQGFAGRLADDLIEVLGRDRVFRDIEIPIGSDFTDVLQRAISASDALLVVIGRHWAAGSEKGYESRLFEPTDWVRTEIEAAFAQGKQVIPVLVGGATMPPPASLPESIQRLTRMQAASMSDRHWDTEIRELADR
ncbi:MAG: toll/interleukin-1 receptor domain-containing protein, partial [Sedimenticolaceae bacterium]